MRLLSNFSQKLQKEIYIIAIYLKYQTSKISNDLKSLYESFYIYVFKNKEKSWPKKPPLHYSRKLGCIAYVLIESKGNPQ